MKAYYYENNGYNGILLTDTAGRWIAYDETFDKTEINRESMNKIANLLTQYEYMEDDFQTDYEQKLDTLMYGDDAQAMLDSQSYYKLIYTADADAE